MFSPVDRMENGNIIEQILNKKIKQKPNKLIKPSKLRAFKVRIHPTIE